ncbi:MAG: glutamine-hydrolyzing GMP synthase, partial [Schwartzia sp.]|nr:glutamine-hydrolyzing GMP synthase [Schwartzia sp. (in: firmicutes)]
MKNELVLVLDFGGQYNQLIARRVRECDVYCEVHPHTLTPDEIRAKQPKGIILTGGPQSVYGDGALSYDAGIFSLGVPVLGICYGSQLMAHALGGEVAAAEVSEYGRADVEIAVPSSRLFENVSGKTVVWMSHTDRVVRQPEGFTVTAKTADCPIAAFENAAKGLYATQFHPEVMHTAEGQTMLRNFVRNICGCKGDWTMGPFIEDTVAAI